MRLNHFSRLLMTVCLAAAFSWGAAAAQDGNGGEAVAAPDSGVVVFAKDFVVRTFVSEDGELIDQIVVPGRPPVSYRAPVAKLPEPNVALGTNTLTEVPAFDWSYGCSATAAAMMMGYYDRHGYPNMYAGPTNGGVCPLDNSVWGHTYYPGVTCGECPLSATNQGIDGRAARGHVEDYWIDYYNAGPDPYIVNGWGEHTWGECTADFMGTNQSKYGNVDGATTFYNNASGAALCDYIAPPGGWDGCHGLRLFAESRGYAVLSNCSQYIYGYNGNTQGFTFADYCAEIDAGRPVIIQVAGHSMLGFGYNTNGNIVYLHDTWDYSDHAMTWGGSYCGMQHYGVTYFRLVPIGQSIETSSSMVSVPENGTAQFGVKLATAPSGSLTVSVGCCSGDSSITVQSGSNLTFDTSNYDTYQYVTLSAADDIDAVEGSAIIRCSASGITPKDITANELEDDLVILTDTSSLRITEGGTGTFYVKLKGQPSASLAVSVARTGGDADISVESGSSLSFTTSDWNTYRPVTIAAAQDADGMDDVAIIRCTTDGWQAADVSVLAADDDSMTISQMKQAADFAPVIGNGVVTAVFGDEFYLESDDRSCGLKVYGPGHGLCVGCRAGVAGVMQTGADGERFVAATAVTLAGTGSVAPLGLAIRSMSGGDWMYDTLTGSGQQGVAGGGGLCTIGLLVRACGRVIDRTDLLVASWNFDSDPGWTYQGQWAWGQPTGSGSHNCDPTSGYTGTNVVGYNLSGDYPDTIRGTHYATTPPIDCTGRTSVRLRFRRWLGVESSVFDHANIQVSNNGVNWTNVWVHDGAAISENTWSYQEYDISSVADNQPTVYVRWGLGPTDASVTYPGWNIDDVEVAEAGNSCCVIDDGSGMPLKVLIPAGAVVPPLGSCVCITGISSCEKVGAEIRSVLKVRSEADITRF